VASSPREQEREIVHILAQDGPHTASQLADALGVSVRTLRSRIKKIGDDSEGLILSTRHGYEIDAEKAKQYLESSERDSGRIPQTNEERAIWVLQQLVRANEPLDIYGMADELYISISTMNLVMAKVRRQLADNDLTVKIANGRISIEGSERNRRRMMSNLLFKESVDSRSEFVGIDTIQDFFPEVDVAAIDSIVIRALDEHHRFANEYYITNLIVHVVIEIDRSNVDVTDGEGPIPNGSDEDTYAIASQIAQQINEACNCHLGEREVNELAILLSSSTKPMNATQAKTPGELRGYIDADTLKLVDKLIETLRDHYDVDLSDDEFYVRFALHINGLMKRMAEGSYVHNPLSADIKARCPLLYDAAVCEAEVIRKETGITINDDEIAYIAFHLGSTLDAQRQLSAKVRVILCCPSWYGVGTRILNFLSTYFGETLVVTSVVESIKPELGQGLDGVDAIVSVSNVRETYGLPLYQIGITPKQEDVAALQALVSRVLKKRRAEHLGAELDSLLSDKAFIYHPSDRSREDAIHTLANRLYDLGLVPQNYESQVLDREALSNTAFGIVAIPHTMSHCATKSTVGILVPEKPISWGESKIELVLMLAFSQLERSAFNEVFDSLVSILQSAERVRKLTGCTAFGEFVGQLKLMLAEDE
jgi:lichenan operon transcriptional antiterminator